MLIAYLISLVFGGGESPFNIDNAEKIIKHVVEDNERKDSILYYLDIYEDDWESLQETKKNQNKKIQELIDDKESGVNEISEELQIHRDQRNKLNQEFIQYRTIVQSLLTESEWTELIREAEVDFNKEKSTKDFLKRRTKLLNNIVKVNKKTQAVFSGASDKKKIEELFAAFTADIETMIDENHNYSIEVVSATSGKKLSASELAEMVYKTESFRARAHTSFLIMYEGLIKLTPDDKWSKVAKQLKRFF